jgi:phage terminase large subunit-like protein
MSTIDATRSPRNSRRTTGRSSTRSTAPLRPFTVEHFRLYANQLVLDSGDPWEPENWQLDVVADIFSGRQQVWLIVPQGNGKTTLMAGLGLYHCDFTPAPWVPVAASSARQARILYESASEFVKRTPRLLERFKPHKGYLRVESLVNGGWGIQVYAADKDTGQGIQPTLCLVDEGHVHKDLGLYRTWRGKLRKRRGQIVMISTAGEPGSDFETTRDAIRDGAGKREDLGPCRIRVESPRIVMHEFRVPKAHMAKDLDVVKAANPLSLIRREDLAEILEDPTLDYGEDWLRQTCNIPARSSKAAISDQDWAAAYTDERIPAGAPVWVGADFAWVEDTTALVPLWVRDDGFRLLGEPAILTPPRDGNMLDPQEVRDAILRLNDRNPIQFIVADVTKAQDTLLWAENELGIETVNQPQGPQSQSLEYESFMDALREGKLRHVGDKGLTKHAMNAITRKLPGDRRAFDRPLHSRTSSKQDRRVIDALKAASMAHLVASTHVESAPFVFEVLG